ncbi:SDR family NAD(P)-dependent oxidoreductase [Erythrobacter westpacificensis]
MNDMRFEDDVVIVTGGGRGMGRAHCLELARRGARVVVNDIGGGMDGEGTDASVAQEVVDFIEAAGGTAIANTSSVATEAGATEILDSALGAFGRIDAVIHNAGIAGFAPIEDISLEEFRKVLAVHLEGGFLIARAAWPHMRQQGYGRIVFITSQTALSGMFNLAHYGSAKAGLTGLGRVLALEGEPYGIRVNSLGVTALTRLMADFFAAGGPADDRPDVLHETGEWWETYNRSELVSPVLSYLVHPDCMLNGELLDTGGGHVSRQFLATTRGFLDLDLTTETLAENIDSVFDPTDAEGPFENAAKFLDWRHAKMIAAGAILPDIAAGAILPDKDSKED